MIRILYVHGYNGSPIGESFQKLAKYATKEYFGEKVEMHTFTYDPDKPFKVARELKHYYYSNDIDLMIGCSLGGFLVANCDWARRIAVNPCLKPSVELPKLGFTCDVSDYTFMEQNLGRYAENGDKDLCIGCFAPADELLGSRYVFEFREHFKETYEIDGGHHLSDEAAIKIMTQIAPRLIRRFKANKGKGHIVRNGLSEFEQLQFAHMHSAYNMDAIKDSNMCGCFYCGRIFPASEVTDYTNEFDGYTALCPICEIDSVIPDIYGDKITSRFLKKMYRYWF